MSPRTPGRPPSPWRRRSAGVYESADGRFSVEGDGPGRWYVRDTAEHDEMGLERTIGPFATLDVAKADAEARRDRPPETSPLTSRMKTRGDEARRRDARSGEGRPSRARRQGHDRQASPAAPPPTWLDRLAADRPTEAERARRRIAALERAGIEDADAVVRRDIESGEPEVAERLLERDLRLRLAAALEPASLEKAVAAAPSASDPTLLGDAWRSGPLATRRLVSLVVERVVAATLDEVSMRERADGSDDDLPGWRLVEHDPGDPGRGRRVRLDADRVLRARSTRS